MHIAYWADALHDYLVQRSTAMATGFDASGTLEETNSSVGNGLNRDDPVVPSTSDDRGENAQTPLPYESHGASLRSSIPPGARAYYNYASNIQRFPTSENEVRDNEASKAFSEGDGSEDFSTEEKSSSSGKIFDGVYNHELLPDSGVFNEAPKEIIELKVPVDSEEYRKVTTVDLDCPNDRDNVLIFSNIYSMHADLKPDLWAPEEETILPTFRGFPWADEPDDDCTVLVSTLRRSWKIFKELRQREDIEVTRINIHRDYQNMKKLWSLKGKEASFLTRNCYAVFVRKKKVHVKKFHSKHIASEQEGDSSETVFHRAFTVEESPAAKLTQPPQFNRGTAGYMQDESSRLRSFQRRFLPGAQSLANAGFYMLDDDRIACYSCKQQWPIRTVRQANASDASWHRRNCGLTIERGIDRLRVRDVVPDGRISDIASDPPGQQSVYIPPGDIQRELYRMSTFESFPSSCPVDRRSLAKSGFYYTGFYDRVKCFSCGRAVEGWDARDNPAHLLWHKDDCALAHNRPSGNIPVNDLFNRFNMSPAQRSQQVNYHQTMNGDANQIVRYPSDLPETVRRAGGTFQIGPGNTVIIQSGPGPRPNPPPYVGNQAAPPQGRWRMANVVSADTRRFLMNLYLNRELDRLTSFARWSMSRPNISPIALAKSGFFYLGDMDRTQCFSCGGVLRNWTIEDDAQEEHRTHFPNCRMALGTEQRNVPVPVQAEAPADLVRIYPCRYAASPHMRSEATRRETFDHRWHAARVDATPASIAEAGFFFLGERDRVKCWYCNGGLQNWEYDDVPWAEHAKWFPNCQFLLQNKGQAFVYRHLSANPHLARPIIAKQEGSPIDPAAGAGEVARARDIPPSTPAVRQPSPPPTIIDPQEEMRKKTKIVENNLQTSETVQNVLAMGFSVEAVRHVLEDKVALASASGEIYTSVASLLDDVMKKDAEMQREAQQEAEEQEERRRQEAEEERRRAAEMSSLASSYSSGLSSIGFSSIGSNPASGHCVVSSFEDDDEDERMDLYSSVMEVAAEAKDAPETNRHTGASSIQAANIKVPDDPKSLQEKLTQIEEERMCKICFNNTADMVFIPCSHMCCCMECTQAIRQCPVCRVKIEKAIKTYSS